LRVSDCVDQKAAADADAEPRALVLVERDELAARIAVALDARAVGVVGETARK